MQRFLLRAELEPSPEAVSALTAASMTVEQPTPDGEPANRTLVLKPDDDEAIRQVSDALGSPPDGQVMTVAVNAPSAEDAIAKVKDTLSRWGEVEIQIIDQESL